MTERDASRAPRFGAAMVLLAGLLAGGASWTRTAHSEDVPPGEKEGAVVRIDKVVIAVTDLGRIGTRSSSASSSKTSYCGNPVDLIEK